LKNFLEKISSNIAKIIKFIGVITFICGFIVSLRFIWEAIDYSDFDAFLIAIAILIGSFISAVFILGFSIIIEKLKESVGNQEEIIKLLNKDNIEEKSTNNESDNVSDIVQSKELDEHIENTEQDITESVKVTSDEDFAFVNIKLLSDFQRQADINNNVFIMVQNEKKYIAGMKQGEVIGFRVDTGNCKIIVGNQYIPICTSISPNIQKGETKNVGLKSTEFGYITLSVL